MHCQPSIYLQFNALHDRVSPNPTFLTTQTYREQKKKKKKKVKFFSIFFFFLKGIIKLASNGSWTACAHLATELVGKATAKPHQILHFKLVNMIL
jgi:hypothetical protein